MYPGKGKEKNLGMLGNTFLASPSIRSIMVELKGTHPLKTAPPPRVFGYSKTLAKVKAPVNS